MTEKPFKKGAQIRRGSLPKKKLTGGRSSGRLLLRYPEGFLKRIKVQYTGAQIEMKLR
jgi:hypothetical protein